MSQKTYDVDVEYQNTSGLIRRKVLTFSCQGDNLVETRALSMIRQVASDYRCGAEVISFSEK